MDILNDLSLGRYIHNDSLVHKIDPRIKLFSLLILGIGTIFIKNFLSLILLSFFLIISVKYSKINFSIWYRGFRIFLWFFLIILILNIFTGYSTSGSYLDILINLKRGIIIILKWAIMIGFCLLFTMSTTPTEIANSLESLFNPLKKIKLPVHDISIMTGLTIMFLPILKEELDRLILVKKLQGIDIASGGTLERIHNIAYIISHIIHRLYRRSEIMALAMEARGFLFEKDSEHNREYLSNSLEKEDIQVLVFLIIFLVLLFCINIFVI